MPVDESKNPSTRDIPARISTGVLVVAVIGLTLLSLWQFHEIHQMKDQLTLIQEQRDLGETEGIIFEKPVDGVSDKPAKITKRQVSEKATPLSNSTKQCGGEIILDHLGDGHTLTSPNYPNPYGGGLDCQWVVRLDQYPNPSAYGGSRTTSLTAIRLMFDGPVDMEASSDCQFDYLEVRSGFEDGPMLGKYCKSENITAPISTSGLLMPMFIKFHSDASVGGKGFSATLSVTPPKVLPTEDDLTGINHAVFTRWGKATCPQGIALYDGYVAGFQQLPNSKAGSQKLQCLPLPLDIINNSTQLDSGAHMTLASFDLADNDGVFGNNHVDRRLVKCALCDTQADEQFTVIGWSDCHSDNWVTAYSGYLMVDYSGSNGVNSDPICMDDSPDVTFETRLTTNSPQLNFVLSGKGVWYENRPMPCAVCVRDTSISATGSLPISGN